MPITLENLIGKAEEQLKAGKEALKNFIPVATQTFESVRRTNAELSAVLHYVEEQEKGERIYREIGIGVDHITDIESITSNKNEGIRNKIKELHTQVSDTFHLVLTESDIKEYKINPKDIVKIIPGVDGLGNCIEVNENGTTYYCTNRKKTKKDSKEHVFYYNSAFGFPIKPSKEALDLYLEESEKVKSERLDFFFKTFISPQLEKLKR